MSPIHTDLTKRILAVYSYYKAFPIVQSAKIVPVPHVDDVPRLSVESEWEQSDVKRGDTFQFVQHHILSVHHNLDQRSVQVTCNTRPVVTSLGNGLPFPMENGPNLIWKIYDSEASSYATCIEYERSVGMKSAPSTVRSCCPESGTFVKIWHNGQYVKTIQLPTIGSSALHGRVYSAGNGVFTGASWSNDSKKIVYTAEAVRPETAEHHADLSSAPFRHQDNWGEGLADVRRTVLCLLDVDSETVTCVVDSERLPNMVPTEPVWCPDGSGILFVAYAMGAYRLGLKYCLQRPRQLFHLDFNSQHLRPISAADKAASCPRLSPNGKRLIWLENRVGGPHMQCQSLRHVDWPWDGTTSPSTIVPIVDVPTEPGGFPGLYCELPTRCWTSDSVCVILSTQWGFNRVPVLVSVSTSVSSNPFRIDPISSPLDSWSSEPSSVNVLDVFRDFAVASISSPVHPPFLAILSISTGTSAPKQASSLKWTILSRGLRLTDSSIPMVSEMRYSILSSPTVSGDIPTCSESLLIRSTSPIHNGEHTVNGNAADNLNSSPAWSSSHDIEVDSVRALIVWPHGGPHSSFSASWDPMVCSFVSLGFACLLVNYRGSLGYGESAVRCLLGRIGQLDVHDCSEAAEIALDRLRDEFGHNLPAVLFGGSHGGFLVLHMAARWPDRFRAAVTRNPVTNLVSMLDTSDIPDWDYVEAGLSPGIWPMDSIPDSTALAKLASMSPLSQLSINWSVPLLTLLGEKDLRVPLSQGLTFSRRLRALRPDVPCEIMVYPQDSHPLNLPVTSKDVFLRTMQWFFTHLGLSS